MVKTQEFDLIVIGAGSGLNVIPGGIKSAVVEKGPMGGTCLNRGCIPSKIVIHSADVAEQVKNASKFGIQSKINKVNFSSVTNRANKIVDTDADNIKMGLNGAEDITLFQGEGKFIGPRTIKVGNKVIKGKKVVIAVGARPAIPNIPGLKDTKFWTSTEALRATKQPKTLTVIGGGYIGCELAHFYGGMGTKINILNRSGALLKHEDSEVSKKFTEVWEKKYNVITDIKFLKVEQKGKTFIVHIQKGKKVQKIKSDALLVATGITPNSDLLDLEKTGVKTDKRGYIKSNDYLETTAKNIWVLGDIAGKYFFKHSANVDADVVYNNMYEKKKMKANYKAMPHAVFSSPQVAGVGATEDELIAKGIEYQKGRLDYIKTGMGTALQDEDGFVKIMVNPRTRKILGCHIMGEQASTLIHEVVVAMRNNLTVDAIADTIHIHPALSEVVHRAILRIQ